MMPMYPDTNRAGERYEPSNGTEGDAFHAIWCCNCERDKVMNGTCLGEPDPETDYCAILNASYRGEAKEWVFGADGYPTCTAFVPVGQPIPPPPDDRTIDMFGGVNVDSSTTKND